MIKLHDIVAYFELTQEYTNQESIHLIPNSCTRVTIEIFEAIRLPSTKT